MSASTSSDPASAAAGTITDTDMEEVTIARAGPLHVIVAIHNTVRGPALGGTRFTTYPSEQHAITDAMRLARGMTHKSALADLALGGGKAVIVGDPAALRSDALLDAYAVVLDRLGGRYITAEDVGTTVADMDHLRDHTQWVVGISPERGGRGDPSPDTALGVFRSMEAVAEHLWSTDLADRHVAIQGLGKVGSHLADLLLGAGCRCTVADVNQAAVAALADRDGVEVVAPDRILAVDCDIFAPCAMGAVLNEASIPGLGCEVVAGAANNQLARSADAGRLRDRGICWVPDYLANAGGIIHVGAEWYDEPPDTVAKRVNAIGGTAKEILTVADTEGITTLAAASRVVKQRLT